MIRRLLILVRKDFRTFLTDPVAIGLSLIVPMVMILVFGVVFGGMAESGLHEFYVLAVNEDSGPAGRRLLQALDKLDEIAIVERLRGDTLALDSVRARQRVAAGKNSVALIVPSDFSEGLKAGQVRLTLLEDPKEKIAAGVVSGLLQREVFSTFPALLPMNLAQMGGDREDSLQWKGFNSGIRDLVQQHFHIPLTDSWSSGQMFPEEMVLGGSSDSTKTGASGPNFGEAFEKMFKLKHEAVVGQEIANPWIAQSVAGPAVMFLLFAVGAIAASLLREMSHGTAQRLIVSRATTGEFLLSKYLYALAFGSAQLIAMMAYGRILFGLDIFRHPLALLVMIVCSAAAMSGIGLFIAAISRTEEQASGFQIVVILGMSAIGGAMFPSFMIPQVVQTLAKATPVHWAMQGFLDVFWRDQSLPGIALECGILLGMAAVLTIIAMLVFRKRLAVELG